jgi:hypothetical protein
MRPREPRIRCFLRVNLTSFHPITTTLQCWACYTHPLSFVVLYSIRSFWLRNRLSCISATNTLENEHFFVMSTVTHTLSCKPAESPLPFSLDDEYERTPWQAWGYSIRIVLAIDDWLRGWKRLVSRRTTKCWSRTVHTTSMWIEDYLLHCTKAFEWLQLKAQLDPIQSANNHRTVRFVSIVQAWRYTAASANGRTSVMRFMPLYSIVFWWYRRKRYLGWWDNQLNRDCETARSILHGLFMRLSCVVVVASWPYVPSCESSSFHSFMHLQHIIVIFGVFVLVARHVSLWTSFRKSYETSTHFDGIIFLTLLRT